MSPTAVTLLLLCLSNTFMTFAWYWHLKGNQNTPLWKIILISWFIALFEYILMIPANRIGARVFNAFELKTIQEVITLSIFVVFAVVYLREPLRWNHVLGFGLIILAVYVVFKKW